MSEENFFPGENGEVGEESTPKVSLEKPRQEVRQGIYQEGGMQRQGEYRESADAAGGSPHTNSRILTQNLRQARDSALRPLCSASCRLCCFVPV